MQEKEIWKDISGYEGSYMVSHLGRVKSLDREIKYPNHTQFVKGRILKNIVDIFGYHSVVLCSDGIRSAIKTHRIIALHFIIKINGKKEINHKNGIKSDNRAENLEWCTRSENMKHAFRSGLKKATYKPVSQYLKNGILLASFKSSSEAALVTQINRGNISRNCTGELKTAGGFIWKYKTPPK